MKIYHLKNMIKPHLRDLINKHKPIEELDNNNGEWRMENSVINYS